MTAGSVAPTGALSMNVTRGRTPMLSLWPSALDKGAIIEHGTPRRGLPAEVNRWRAANQRHLFRGWRRIAAARALGVPTYYGALWCTVKRGETGEVIPYGLASLRVVTTAGVGYIVDAFQNLVEPENMKFHGYGTGSVAEAAGDTALDTELTTQYNPDSTRPTGTTTEGASANIYRTVATLTPDSGGSIVLREHGIFSATSAGVLLDRSVFAAITLDATLGDSLQTTYELTFPSGS
jgi:hypothetical protein